jgi:hypothetical protein
MLSTLYMTLPTEVGVARNFVGTDGLKGSHQVRKYRRRRNGKVMGTENHPNLRCQRGKSPDRGTIGCEISLGAVEPDGAGIVCVAG